MLVIGERIRQLRIQRGLTLGDVEKASGLLAPYISRVERGHTVPSLEILERFASVLEVPLYRLFLGPVAGAIVQEFELPDSTGAPQRLSALTSRGPLVLLFYRGHW
jgi:transcriptional regulator with XRE-family HTH domain